MNPTGFSCFSAVIDNSPERQQKSGRVLKARLIFSERI
jgi:hypothetical protein